MSAASSCNSLLRGRAAIVGAGLGGVPMAPGRSPLEILSEAVHGALADAGLKLSDVDGLFTGSAYHFLAGLSVAEYLGLHPKFCEATMVGGSSYVGHLLTAAMALHTGQCEVALVCYGSNRGFGPWQAQVHGRDAPLRGPLRAALPDLEL